MRDTIEPSAEVQLSGVVVGILKLDEPMDGVRLVSSRRNGGSGYLYTIAATKDAFQNLIIDVEERVNRPADSIHRHKADDRRALAKALDALRAGAATLTEEVRRQVGPTFRERIEDTCKVYWGRTSGVSVDEIEAHLAPKASELDDEDALEAAVIIAADQIRNGATSCLSLAEIQFQAPGEESQTELGAAGFRIDDELCDEALKAEQDDRLLLGGDEGSNIIDPDDMSHMATGYSEEENTRRRTIKVQELTAAMAAMLDAEKRGRTAKGKAKRAAEHDFNQAANLRSLLYNDIGAEFGEIAAFEAEQEARQWNGWDLDDVQKMQLAQLRDGTREPRPASEFLEMAARMARQIPDAAVDTPPVKAKAVKAPAVVATAPVDGEPDTVRRARELAEEREQNYAKAVAADPKAKNIAALRAVATRARTLYQLAVNTWNEEKAQKGTQTA